MEKYPSVSKYLGSKQGHASSEFLLSEKLVDDDFLNIDYIKKLTPNDLQFGESMKMVFHWGIWDIIHSGRINEFSVKNSI
jgi:hypothetical protein